MAIEEESVPQKANLLVFAPDRVGLTIPRPHIEARNYLLTFEPFNSERRLDEYDGAIVFQRTFEDLKRVVGEWEAYWKHFCYHDDLDRRTKEAELLLEKGGFIC